jgi:hypothetical protein
MAKIFWWEFGILLAAALFGTVAVLPYSLRLLTTQPSYPSLMLSLLQNAFLASLAIWAGLRSAHAIGLGAPFIEAALTHTNPPSPKGFVIAVCLGASLGALLLIADLFFMPHWPEALREVAPKTTLLENLLASFYGGINEELLMRLFGLSVLAWFLSFQWRTASGTPTVAAFWTANVIMAVLFGIAHLPALKSVIGTIPPLMLIRTLLLNAPVALACGWLFWTYGIETTIVAHFSADIIVHVVSTAVLRRLG